MLCLIADDGGWIVPETNDTVRGDVNADGELTIADAVLMQKWILSVPGSDLADWKAGDLCKDGIIDSFDRKRVV